MGKVKKAIAGGVTGAIAAVAGFAFGDDVKASAGRLFVLIVTGFAAGFIGVYIAPANTVR